MSIHALTKRWQPAIGCWQGFSPVNKAALIQRGQHRRKRASVKYINWAAVSPDSSSVRFLLVGQGKQQPRPFITTDKPYSPMTKHLHFIIDLTNKILELTFLALLRSLLTETEGNLFGRSIVNSHDTLGCDDLKEEEESLSLSSALCVH